MLLGDRARVREADGVRPRAPADRNQVSKEKLGLLEKKVGRVTVTLTDAPAGVTVTVNAKPLAPERIGTPVGLAPGKVSVVASAAGHPDQRAEVVDAAGEDNPAALHFAPAANGGPIAPVATTSPASSSGVKMSTMRVAGIAVAGVGVVGFVVFAIAGSSSNAKYAVVKAHCSGPCTDPKYIGEVSSGQDARRGRATSASVSASPGSSAAARCSSSAGRKSDAGAATIEIGPRSVRVAGTF